MLPNETRKMAEGGGDEKDENPFSFKKFVQKDDTDEPNRNGDTVDAENCIDPDLLHVAPDRMERRDADGRRSSKDDRESGHSNPFSFKKFLQNSSKSTSSNGPGSFSTLDLAHDLPEFVNSHYHDYSGADSPHSRHRNHPVTDVPLPDFALDSNPSAPLPDLNPPSVKQENSYSSFPYRDRENVIPPDLNDVGPDNIGSNSHSRNVPSAVSPLDVNDLAGSDSDGDVPCPTLAAGGLPDFLRDNVVSNGARLKASPLVLENGLHNAEDSRGDDSSGVIRRLTEENSSLRQELEEAKTQTESETNRVSSVLKEKDAIVSKDAEDTAALENVILQVEANLETATRRAVTAEKTLSRQKQELKHLQAECNRLRRENQALREAGGDSCHLHDKSRRAADQLTAAAHIAEQQLKQLLSGVDQLKMIADILSSVDKVQDIVADSTSSPQGAEGYLPS